VRRILGYRLPRVRWDVMLSSRACALDREREGGRMVGSEAHVVSRRN
jgi:hypothetical protein